MNILIWGAAGFIGTNLTIKLLQDPENILTLVDCKKEYFSDIKELDDRVRIIESDFSMDTNFDSIVNGIDVVYHLMSSTVPTTSNQQISEELMANVVVTSKLLEACIASKVKKLVFISSGGTVYGKDVMCPIKEETPTNPITSYGVQKLAIEKLLYLYRYMHGLDYRVIRLANPYGPYQRPNGILGAVTTFTYKALMEEVIDVYGDGSVIRDYIYIEDAIEAIIKIVQGDSEHRIFNLGSGYGTSVSQLLKQVELALEMNMQINYLPGRSVDVPINYLDISRYENAYGKLNPTSLNDGIRKTAEFLKRKYDIDGGKRSS